MNAMLEVSNLKQEFHLTKTFFDSLKVKNNRIVREKKIVHALNDINFSVNHGETFSLVGESGCGKSTTARTVIKILEPKAGKIVFNRTDITSFSRKQLLPFRKKMQMIFQDPYASL